MAAPQTRLNFSRSTAKIRPVPSLSLRVRYRPVRIGWCIESGNWEQLREALTLTNTLAGGRFNPLIPVDVPELAEQLVDRFRVDVLFPVADTETIQRFRKSHDYLMWPEFRDHTLFFGRWEHIPPHAKYVDVYHAARRLMERKSRKTKALNVTWNADDPLAMLMLAVIGAYPTPSDAVPDYADMVGQLLPVEAIVIGSDDKVPVVRARITPSLLTTVDLTLDGAGPDHGVYVGQCDNFDDLVTFWNLRAAGSGVSFVDPRYLSRFDDVLAAAHKKWLSRMPARPWQRDGSITVYGRGFRDSPRDLSFVNERVIQHEVSTASWNGLNIKPALPHWAEHAILGSVDDSGRTPSLTLALPPKPSYDDPVFSQQYIVASILGSDHWTRDEDITFFPPYIPEMNEYYGRELYFQYAHVRAEPPDIWLAVSVFVRCSASDLTLRGLPVAELTAKMFESFGITATPSDAGLVTSRLIAQMGGIQGCRVFKISGVRTLIAKYSPDQAFTRSGAIQIIRDVDPETKIPSFALFEDLFIATRDRKKKLNPQDALDYLLERGVFRVGLELKCPNCQLAFWQSIDDVKVKAESEYCGKIFAVARQLRDHDWAFRRSGLFGRSDHQKGGIPVAITLQQLDANLSMDRRLFATSQLLTSSGESAINPCETDFVLITSGPSQHYRQLPQVVIGECKTRGAITPDDARNLAKVADALPYRRLNVFILFAKLGDFSSDEIQACALAQHKWASRVILLSQRELEPYFLYERHPAEPRLQTTSLENLAQNTTYLYPELRPKGFLEIEAADAARRAALTNRAADAAAAPSTGAPDQLASLPPEN